MSRQINSEIIIQLYLGIMSFSIGRGLLLRVCFFYSHLIIFSHPDT